MSTFLLGYLGFFCCFGRFLGVFENICVTNEFVFQCWQGAHAAFHKSRFRACWRYAPLYYQPQIEKKKTAAMQWGNPFAWQLSLV